MTEPLKAIEREVLDILRDDARKPLGEMAKLLGVPESEVKAVIEELERNGTIVKYKAVINSERIDQSSKVTALIEVKVTPKRGYGFDKIAERLYQFPEVRSLYLLSGGYDLMAFVEGKTLHEVAGFVSEKLSTLDDVQSTSTHFLLKRYKEDGDILSAIPEVSRLEVTP